MPDKQAAKALLDKAGIKSYTYDLDHCLWQAPSFPTVQIVGSYSDLTKTCGLVVALVSGKVGRGDEQTGLALRARNWIELDAGQRIEVAQRWIQEVLLIGRTALNESNQDFELNFTPEFAKIESRYNKDQSITIELWVQSAGSPRHYKRQRFRFENDGELGTTETLSWFQVSEGS